MTLLDAKVFDEARARRKRRVVIGLLLLAVLVAMLLWRFRYWPEERAASKFFAALQKQDYEGAYGMYFADPDWKQHPQKHSTYPYSEFNRDWGPGGEWGLVKEFRIYGSSTCPGGDSGVVVDVIVNGRAEHAQVWVQKSDKTISVPPCDLLFR
jgi:hypothetical protein